MPNYFDILGLTPAFDIDEKTLEKSYFDQQRQSHPDRFVGKPAGERQAAMQRSVDINNAYETLGQPLSRAQYLLKLEGIIVGTEQDSIKPSHELLTEIMEWRERIEESADLHKVEEELVCLYEDTMRLIAENYKAKNWQAMANATLRLSYVVKIRQDLAHRIAGQKRHVL